MIPQNMPLRFGPSEIESKLAILQGRLDEIQCLEGVVLTEELSAAIGRIQSAARDLFPLAQQAEAQQARAPVKAEPIELKERDEGVQLAAYRIKHQLNNLGREDLSAAKSIVMKELLIPGKYTISGANMDQLLDLAKKTFASFKTQLPELLGNYFVGKGSSEDWQEPIKPNLRELPYNTGSMYALLKSQVKNMDIEQKQKAFDLYNEFPNYDSVSKLEKNHEKKLLRYSQNVIVDSRSLNAVIYQMFRRAASVELKQEFQQVLGYDLDYDLDDYDLD